MTRTLLFVLAAVLGAAAHPSAASSQTENNLQGEVRIDAITGNAWAIHGGFGVTAGVGTYVRAGVIGGVGVGGDGGGSGGVTSGRTDLVVRFNLDPFRSRRWGPYAVGGVSARYGESSRTEMLLMFGMEGPVWGKMTPALELGLGGGVRIAAVMRQAMPRRR